MCRTCKKMFLVLIIVVLSIFSIAWKFRIPEFEFIRKSGFLNTRIGILSKSATFWVFESEYSNSIKFIRLVMLDWPIPIGQSSTTIVSMLTSNLKACMKALVLARTYEILPTLSFKKSSTIFSRDEVVHSHRGVWYASHMPSTCREDAPQKSCSGGARTWCCSCLYRGNPSYALTVWLSQPLIGCSGHHRSKGAFRHPCGLSSRHAP